MPGTRSLFISLSHTRVLFLSLSLSLISDSVPLYAIDAIDTEQKIVERGVPNLCTRITNGSRASSLAAVGPRLAHGPRDGPTGPRTRGRSGGRRAQSFADAPLEGRLAGQSGRDANLSTIRTFMYKLKGKSKTITDYAVFFLSFSSSPLPPRSHAYPFPSSYPVLLPYRRSSPLRGNLSPYTRAHTRIHRTHTQTHDHREALATSRLRSMFIAYTYVY